MTLEFKERLSRKVLKGLSTDLAAFANTLGGIIVVGISDSQELVGYTPEKSERNKISTEAANCRPLVRVDFQNLTFERKRYLLIIVPKSSSLHCDSKFRFPSRVGSITQHLDSAGIIARVRDDLIKTL
ncbi:MAG: ATP-binding protein [Thermoplasmata archaeon]